MKSKFSILLIDNGSLKSDSVLAFRQVADALSARLGINVEPISLLHSSKIDSNCLNNIKAKTLRMRFKESVENNEDKIICLPFFLGPSLAITSYIHDLINEIKILKPNLEILVGDPLCGHDINSPDIRLAEILADNINEMFVSQNIYKANIFMVDHGSPIKKMADLRNNVCQQLAGFFNSSKFKIKPCSMERREGEKYNFNEPLLADVLPSKSLGNENLVISMFFLLPGRHAGDGGDVDCILKELDSSNRFKKIIKSKLVGDHKLVQDILEDRFKELIDSYNSI